MTGYKVKSKKWYGRFWLPERRKMKLMQALIDYQAPEVEKKIQKAWKDHMIYGKPLPTSREECTNSYVKNGKVYDCTCLECF